ncbi:MAG TPA: hypothetical protein VFT16_00540 [Candidatus Saccharimonadales bacterium]|nr:hypothetical protein [Candidatus Saccharimonadales bacterium]
MSRVGFWDLFILNPDGSITPRKHIKIAGVILEPTEHYSKGILFSGWDLFQYLGRDLELEEQPNNRPPVVTGVY